MQFSVMPILALAFFGSMVSADCCKNGLNYCGSGLLNKGAETSAKVMLDCH